MPPSVANSGRRLPYATRRVEVASPVAAARARIDALVKDGHGVSPVARYAPSGATPSRLRVA